MQKVYDAIVVGSGAAGLSAAVTAAHGGLSVLLAEKAPVVGGTTCWSGGWIYAPRNPLARNAGVDEVVDAPLTYLRGVLGENFDADKIAAFLGNAPEMVGFFENNTALKFESGTTIPDTYGQVLGSGTGGRSVIARPYDARGLGPAIALLRHPKPETAFKGMTIQAGADLSAFMTMLRSPRAAAYVIKRVLRHWRDLALHGRGMDLRNGTALVARLMRAALDAGVEIEVSTAASRLITEGRAVRGIVFDTQDGPVEVRSRKGIVLASGGFGNDADRRAALFPSNENHLTMTVSTATGDGARMGEAVGAQFDTTVASPGAWCPVSRVPYPDGSFGVFPHIIERGKPGIIGVLSNGRRFCNEGNGYHDYVLGMLQATPPGQTVESWLVCSHRFQRRYGLGISRPAPLPVWPWIRNGYLKSGRTIGDLARACGIDPHGLERTVRDFNAAARRGEDPEFDRGGTLYNRHQGDKTHGPNPCVAPIEHGPFYAVKVVPGSFGTFAGLRTNGKSEVLDQHGQVIPGLYAAGADMMSVMGGHYPAGGINLGPALTFGYIAGKELAGNRPPLQLAREEH